MRIPSWLRAAAGAPTRYKLRQEAAAFFAATENCRRTQRRVLAQLLALNADSQFGREFRLHDVREPLDFVRRLPITGYDFYRPYIEQLQVGCHSALLGPQNRLMMFAVSSGTTAESKFIPITQPFLTGYRRGWHIWGIRTYDDHPQLKFKNIVQLSSAYSRFRTPAGTPCGNISGLVAAMQGLAVRLLYTVPGIVSQIADPDAKSYAVLRLALADENVGMLSTANPSTLLQLLQFADREQESLIRDIADGTLSAKYGIDDHTRHELRRRTCYPNRRRARQLEQIVARTDRLRPCECWPRMDVLSVWTAGSCGLYLPRLQREFGDVAIRDHGLSASEGRMTLPIHDDRPEGILDITTHYFEFIPESERESTHPVVLGAHELRPDENYYILLTTSSGLYRYDICDVVRCVGFHGTTPLLSFLHKGAHIANVTGEKISESQVIEAVRAALRHVGFDLQQFTVLPVWGNPPGYQLFVEQHDLPPESVVQRLALHVEWQLQRLNCEYRDKRCSGRLAPLEVLPVAAGTWVRLAEQRMARRGGSPEQYKHPCLIADMEFGAQFVNGIACGVDQPFACGGTPNGVRANGQSAAR